jgi:hypothetical protein
MSPRHPRDCMAAYTRSLRARLREEHGFQTRIDHMAIYGYCPGCRKD